MAPTDISAAPALGPHRGKCYHVRGVSACQYISAKRCALGTLELAFKNQGIQWVFCVDEQIEKAVDIMLAWIAMRRHLLRQGKLDSGIFFNVRFDGKLSNGKEYKRMLAKFWRGEEAVKVLREHCLGVGRLYGADGGMSEFCRRFVDMLTNL